MDVGVVLINSTTVKVTWAPIDRELVRGKLLGYKVKTSSLHFWFCRYMLSGTLRLKILLDL